MLFKRLSDSKTFELADVAEYALSLHKEAESIDSIEFIIAYYEEGTFHLDCVKNNTIKRDVPNCYIGSVEAFRLFQKIRYEHKSKEQSIKEYTDRAFRDVVDGCSDDVGGIYGFADFLLGLNEGEPEQRESCKVWASSLGWTGREAKPKSVL